VTVPGGPGTGFWIVWVAVPGARALGSVGDVGWAGGYPARRVLDSVVGVDRWCPGRVGACAPGHWVWEVAGGVPLGC
jgi:hypothetical protein